MYNKEEILTLAEEHKEHVLGAWEAMVDNKQTQVRGREYSTTSPLDLMLMFLFILDRGPSHAIEFSPWIGYSSSVIASAMRVLGHQNAFATFEMSRNLDPHIQERIRKYGLQDYMQVVYGDAIPAIEKFLDEYSNWRVGFCFSDCCHTRHFGNEYIARIFPRLEPDCLIFVHDVSSNSKGEFRTNTPRATEYEAIRDWVNRTKPDYMLTHQMFGGQVENSENLPQDEQFFNALTKILGKNILDYEKSSPVCFVCQKG